MNDGLPTVMFVDDEPSVLQGLRRLFRSKKDCWRMLFANSGNDALALMSHSQVDVLVTDMRMPGMDGAELLRLVSELYPITIRIILSGQCDEESLLRTVGVSHQYLSKPCDSALLEQKVSRALGLRATLSDPALRSALGGLRCIPSAPTTYIELLTELKSGTGFTQRLEEIIVRDPALTARLLQVANSAYFGAPRGVRTALQAINLLGFETLRSLALEQGLIARLSQPELWSDLIGVSTRHSLLVASLSRELARCADFDSRNVEEAFTGGMLHDIGKWILAEAVGTKYHELLRVNELDKTPLAALERELIGTDHCQIAAYLLALWGLPDTIVESALLHHEPAHLRGHDLDTPILVWSANQLLSSKGEAIQARDLPPVLSANPGLWDAWRRRRDHLVRTVEDAAA